MWRCAHAKAAEQLHVNTLQHTADTNSPHPAKFCHLKWRHGESGRFDMQEKSEDKSCRHRGAATRVEAAFCDANTSLCQLQYCSTARRTLAQSCRLSTSSWLSMCFLRFSSCICPIVARVCVAGVGASQRPRQGATVTKQPSASQHKRITHALNNTTSQGVLE